MLDQRALIAGLDDYHSALGRQVETVRTEFHDVEMAWRSLDECFQGTAADEFRPIWEAAESRFREYVERSTELGVVLQKRLEHLRNADRPVWPPMD